MCLMKISLVYKVDDGLSPIEYSVDDVIEISQLIGLKNLGMDLSKLPLEMYDRLQTQLRKQLVDKFTSHENA